MKKQIVIGIDVSKSWLDAHVLIAGSSERYDLRVNNEKKGFKKLMIWIAKQVSLPGSEWLFCMEHTGIYSYGLNAHLQDSSISQCMVNALAIKRSMGIVRGKTDKADARLIAQYALRFQDQLEEFRLPSENLQKLKIQLGQRERMVNIKKQLELAVQSMEGLPDQITREARTQNNKMDRQLRKNILELDKSIKEIIKSDASLKEQAKQIESVPGIGPQIAAHLLVITQGMTLFKNSRKFACYCGIAPFEYSSGSSYRGRTKVHFLANRKMKSLLHMASLNAITYDDEIKAFYEKKKSEGKHSMSVLNAVRFKLIDRVFAVVKRKEMFDRNFLKAA